jgi:putative membrane protein
VPLVEVLAAVWYLKWRGVEFTALSYRLVFIHVIVQLIGGHYTYAEVPAFNWLRDEFGWSRNHYDRLAHFALGYCLYIPVREICLRRTPLSASPAWAAFFTFTTITAAAGLWEVWEWLVAATAYSDLGATYLGTQGDPWDAQKDIILAPIGVVFAWLSLTRLHDRTLQRVATDWES